MPGIFISYRRDDSAYIAAAINEKFQQRFGEEHVFFDIDTIPLGVDFRDHIGGAVGGCDVLLVVIGDQWVNATDKSGETRLNQSTDYVRVEIESALQRNVPVVPVLVGNAVMPTDAQLPESIRDLAFRNAAEVRAGRDLNEHLERLIRDVGKVAGISPTHPVSAGAPSPTADTSPANANAQTAGASTSTSTSTSSNAASKSRGPLLVVSLLILVGVGVAIAFATGMFGSPSESDSEKVAGNDKAASNDRGPVKDDSKDQLAMKDAVSKDGAIKDRQSIVTTKAPTKDAAPIIPAIKDSPVKDTPTKIDPPTVAPAKDASTKDTPTHDPNAVDRTDAKATAIAILTAFKTKAFLKLSTLVPESKRKEFADLAALTETHPRYIDVFHGWRGDALKTWTGQVEEPRYEKRPSDAGRIKAIVRFEQKSLTPLVAVAMYLADGKWEFEDLESPPEVLYKKMSTERPK